MIQEPEKRHRNVAHLWADKQIIRFFRKNFDKTHYKNLRSVYLALCEIDSDFSQKGSIKGFTQTVATYAGLYPDTIRVYLKALQKSDILDYWQENDGEFGNTTLTLYKWEPTEEEMGKRVQIINRILSRKHRSRENPTTEKPDIGETRPYKNNTKVLGLNKNTKVDSSSVAEEVDEGSKMSINPLINDPLITPSMFEQFWKSYPRKVDKGKTLTIWGRLCSRKDRPTWSTLNSSITAQKASARWQSKQFIPHPSTWLNQSRWLDDPAEMNNGYSTTSDSNTNPTNSGKSIRSIVQEHGINPLLIDSYLSSHENALELFTNRRLSIDEEALIHQLLTFHDTIQSVQDTHLTDELRKHHIPPPLSIMNNYITWLADNSWIGHVTLDTFEIKSKLFNKYRQHELTLHHEYRDPLTGL